ncbi:DUF3344 domain-containing protein [Clostridium sp. YIM B02551]|uniref:DUF3344 domain-containing protein n=1 Tax=Clostridium sp. YIM B02551 TaxID=2910679 RepID=UPI001EEB1069|nr:DUF3344 domain-containing protein [Clostridium sp. YIM B02551]
MDVKNIQSPTFTALSDGKQIKYALNQNQSDVSVMGIAPNPIPLTEFYNITLYGDYVANGIGLAINGAGTINISLPNGSTIVAAFLFWDVSKSIGTLPVLPSGILNGNPITGTLIGSTGFASDVDGFYADVTNLVKIGDNELSGFPRIPGRYQTDGASLVVIYYNYVLPYKTIVLNKGIFYFFRETAYTTINNFKAANSPIIAKTTYMVGQTTNGNDAAYFNGSTIATNVFNFSSGFFWSNVTLDVSNQVNPGDTTAIAGILNAQNNILIWVAQAFSVNAAIQPSTEVRGIDFYK